jgi:hypothetical protein
MMSKIPITLQKALSLLPDEDDEGWYFELRKQRPAVISPETIATGQVQVQWVCAKSNFRTNQEACNNVGSTPEEAIYKMLLRCNIVHPRDPDSSKSHPAPPDGVGWACDICGQVYKDRDDAINCYNTNIKELEEDQYREVEEYDDIPF